jgi:hypothetical protein
VDGRGHRPRVLPGRARVRVGRALVVVLGRSCARGTASRQTGFRWPPTSPFRAKRGRGMTTPWPFWDGCGWSRHSC